MSPKFLDLGGPNGVPEDERIKLIGNKAMLGQTVGVLVEDDHSDPGKPDRYAAKVISKFPAVELVYCAPYMTTDVGQIMLLKFARKKS